MARWSRECNGKRKELEGLKGLEKASGKILRNLDFLLRTTEKGSATAGFRSGKLTLAVV